MNYWWWWCWWCQSRISCRIPGEKNVGPGLVCTKVGLAIVVGDLWPGFSINVWMEPPSAMKKHRQNIGKMDQNCITYWSMIYWVRHLKHSDTAGNWVWPGIWWIWGARTLSEVSVRRRTGRIQRIQRMDLPAAFEAWQSGASQAVLPQSPTAVGKPRYVHGKTRRSGHSATAGLCKAWWLMGKICLASSHMQDSSNIEQHTNRSLGNPEIGELKFGAQIQWQRLGRTFLLARIPASLSIQPWMRHSWHSRKPLRNPSAVGWFSPTWTSGEMAPPPDNVNFIHPPSLNGWAVTG